MDQARWKQIETLYHTALELTARERALFLAERCAGDADLFHEVHSLLSSHEREDGFLSKPEFELGLKILDEKGQVLQAGQRLGNYEILKLIGRGGMGEVYLAQDVRLKRRVALKLLPSDVTVDKARVKRFLQEASAASQIVHPNVAQVYEAGETGGIHFIVMEFVDGETLRDRMAQNPIPAEEILSIARQIAAALEAAHASGIVHRDLKPENIMIRHDGVVKVLDFSLAKLTRPIQLFASSAETEQSTFHTEPGLVLGTAPYMSPEQARGQNVDHRTDLWSFGILFYEMLTGKTPFRGATSMDTIAAILTAEPSKPDILKNSDEFWQIIFKSLRKELEERYQSAKEILYDLENPHLEIKAAPGNLRPDETKTKESRIARATEDFFTFPPSSTNFKIEQTSSKPPIRRPLRSYITSAVYLIVFAGGLFLSIQLWLTYFSKEVMVKPLADFSPRSSDDKTLFRTAKGLARAPIFEENFDGYVDGIQDRLQPGTGLRLSFNGNVPGWNKSVFNDVHAVDFGGGNYAASFIYKNKLTLNSEIAANEAETTYTVLFDAGPSVYFVMFQATIEGDGLLIKVLRPDDSVLASGTVLPGAWVTGPNAQDLTGYFFTYTGDGTGPVRLEITTADPSVERFGGAIDNLSVSEGTIDSVADD